MTNLIELKNIVKNYNAKKKIKVLNKINFSFKAGKIYSLMGPSGSGKSTLLNLLSLIDTPNSGTLKISNHVINHKLQTDNDKLRANKIGIIYQDNNLLPDQAENAYSIINKFGSYCEKHIVQNLGHGINNVTINHIIKFVEYVVNKKWIRVFLV